MTPQNRRIAAKLEQLRTGDPDCHRFGVNVHRYRFASPLSPSELKAIQHHYQISLPEEYAAFLSEVGNGGAGPGYGLQRFGFVLSADDIPRAETKGSMRVVLKTPGFTLSRPDLFDASGRRMDPFEIAFYNSIKGLTPDGDFGPGSLAQPFPLTTPVHNDERWKNLNLHGAFMLADYGCGMAAYLVLNGAFRGDVWLLDPNTAWFVPFNERATLHYVEAEDVKEADRHARFTFAAWYEHWLDHELADLKANHGHA